MQLQDLSPELSDALGYLRGRGVLITAVEPDSPADDAGIERGLVIYRVGKYDVHLPSDRSTSCCERSRAARTWISRSASSARGGRES